LIIQNNITCFTDFVENHFEFGQGIANKWYSYQDILSGYLTNNRKNQYPFVNTDVMNNLSREYNNYKEQVYDEKILDKTLDLNIKQSIQNVHLMGIIEDLKSWMVNLAYMRGMKLQDLPTLQGMKVRSKRPQVEDHNPETIAKLRLILAKDIEIYETVKLNLKERYAKLPDFDKTLEAYTIWSDLQEASLPECDPLMNNQNKCKFNPKSAIVVDGDNNEQQNEEEYYHSDIDTLYNEWKH